MAGIALLGGSFNPLHIGHLRFALEVHEALGKDIERIDLLPCAHPPHKKASGLLPFELRVAAIRNCIAQLSWLSCSEIENEREELSYTWDTLALYRETYLQPEQELFFLLGSTDYSILPSWRNGLRLPERCNFIVSPRGHYSVEDFVKTTKSLWPDACETQGISGVMASMKAGGGIVHFFPVPWLEISASFIRERWLAGRSLDYLIPKELLSFLEKERKTIEKYWFPC